MRKQPRRWANGGICGRQRSTGEPLSKRFCLYSEFLSHLTAYNSRFRPLHHRRSLPMPVASVSSDERSHEAQEHRETPSHLLQARLMSRMKRNTTTNRHSTGTALSTPTLVADSESIRDSTEQTPLKQRFISRASQRTPVVSSAYLDRSLKSTMESPSQTPSVSDAPSSSAAGLALSDIRARLKAKSTRYSAADKGPPASSPAMVQAGRQRLAAFKTRRESLVSETGSSYASSSYT